ncbi:MAG TPA: TolC family protein [Terracidiphilus sp.]|nr:TolC family protein [Terracidiphilus sp.]
MRTSQAHGGRGCVWRRSPGFVVLCLISIFSLPTSGNAQVDFASTMRLALQNSPRVRAAQLDVKKTQKSLAIAKDIFIPSVVMGGGLGWTHGITLTVPTIFTVNAQSLVYSNQQRFTVRAARADLEAAQLALAEAMQQTEEDAAITYFALDENEAALNVLSQQQEFAGKLVSILEDRVHAGLDSDLDVKKGRRGVLQIELEKMQAEDDRGSLIAHLAELTGLQASEVRLIPNTAPSVPDPKTGTDSAGDETFATPGLLAAEATARGKLERAKGEAGYTWKPIINFAAQYGRVSPINDVSSFYNLHGNYNTANIGVQFSFPIFDRIRKEAAQVSAADAARSQIDVSNHHVEEIANRAKLQHSVREAAVRAQMAELDYGIAEDELQSTIIELHGATGSPPLTPKDEQNAKIQDRQKYLDMLDARLQLSKAKVSLLRQTGQLDRWVHSVMMGVTP